MSFAHKGAGVVLSMVVMLSGCSDDDQVRLHRDLQRQVAEANQRADQAREEVKQLHTKREQDRRVLEARERNAAADVDAAMTVTMATAAAFIILLLICARSVWRKEYAYPVVAAGPKVDVPIATPPVAPVQHRHQLPAPVSVDRPSVSIPVHMFSQRRCQMLCLTRRIGEVLCIGRDVRVHVLGVSGSQIRIGVMAPAEVSIDRLEVRRRKLDARRRPNGGRRR